jgi:hypothetical protein
MVAAVAGMGFLLQLSSASSPGVNLARKRAMTIERQGFD